MPPITALVLYAMLNYAMQLSYCILCN